MEKKHRATVRPHAMLVRPHAKKSKEMIAPVAITPVRLFQCQRTYRAPARCLGASTRWHRLLSAEAAFSSRAAAHLERAPCTYCPPARYPCANAR
ncbi:hypothetical protein PIB30_066511 [Stylosanthes scabra]|uniref:Uncharacterized protein n=1 Tax=Stylosanthes scabra TaxID=79078 RepID=A0ABU6WNZ9_9FABA|nr:hypothetical protein [Stylosanthes scabra]